MHETILQMYEGGMNKASRNCCRVQYFSLDYTCILKRAKGQGSHYQNQIYHYTCIYEITKISCPYHL
jgi:hypothetical protein